MTKKILKFLFFILIGFLLISIKADPSEEDIKAAINRMKTKSGIDVDSVRNMRRKNIPPSVVVFYFEPDKVKEREMYSYYLKEFLSTFGMTVTNFYYGHKDELIATLQVGDDFDKNYVLSTFKGVIRDVLVRDFTKDL